MSRGALYALLAYGAWGLSPIFWKELVHLPVELVLAHRVIWAAVVFYLLLRWTGGAKGLGRAMVSRSALVLFTTALLLVTNWFIYLFAVSTNRILDASLGYFINPLLNVVLGMLVLGERLRGGQWIAVALALVGVLRLATAADRFPWIALALAGSFGLYGLLRKTAPQDALLGSNIETGFMIPVALVYLLAPTGGGEAMQALAPVDWMLLLGTGLQTALPLLWFSSAARRLPLSTLGFFQYIAPSLQFLLAVFWFAEPFDAVKLQSFGLIWAALAVFSLEANRHRRRIARIPLQA